MTIGRLAAKSATETYRPAALAYHPRMMLKLLVYSYSTGIFSSRAIARGVEENVALALHVVGTPRRESRAKVFAILKQLGLQHRRYHHPLSLSGGEQQRVAIARALVNRPRLLLADEPTGNLDTSTSLEIMRIIEQLNREQGITVVLVTHEPEIAAYADRLLTFRDGEIVDDVAQERSSRISDSRRAPPVERREIAEGAP